MVAADAEDHMIANDDGSDGGSVIELGIGDSYFPALFTRPGVDADQVAIRGFEEEPILVHANATVTDRATGVGRIGVVPEFATGTYINSPGVVGRGQIENTVDKQGR